MSEKRVYFMKPIGMAGPIKIGCSDLPERRLRTYDIWSPFPLELLATAPGSFWHERALHWLFRGSHSHGEWFYVDQALLSVIDHVRLNGVLPPLEASPANAKSRRRNPGRPNSRVKSALTGRISSAERHAFGYWGKENRPAWVSDAVASWQGPHTPPPTADLVAKLEAYILELRLRPKASRTLDDWMAWRAAKAAA